MHDGWHDGALERASSTHDILDLAPLPLVFGPRAPGAKGDLVVSGIAFDEGTEEGDRFSKLFEDKYGAEMNVLVRLR
mgnify:CR=1 FL=1